MSLYIHKILKHNKIIVYKTELKKTIYIYYILVQLNSQKHKISFFQMHWLI